MYFEITDIQDYIYWLTSEGSMYEKDYTYIALRNELLAFNFGQLLL